MTTSGSTETLASAEAFDSLAALRSAHDALLGSLADGTLDEPDLSAVQDFAARAAATGRILDDASDRRAAQGLIDYWVASSYTGTRSSPPGEGQEGLSARRLLPFDEDTVHGFVTRGDAALLGLDEPDRELARRILLNLAHMAPTGRDIVVAPVSVAALKEGLGDPVRVERLIAALVEAGALRRLPGGEGDDKVELAHQSLIRQWPMLRDWLEQRAKFRDAAVFWDRSGREPGALLSGPLLQKATLYPDLSPLEHEFVNRSGSRGLRRLTIALSVVSLLLTAAIVFAVIAFVAQRNAEAARVAAEQAREQAEQARKQANDEAVQARSRLERIVTTFDKAIRQMLDEGDLSEAQKQRLFVLLAPVGALLLPEPTPALTLRTRLRPVPPGASVGPENIASGGSICCFVRDAGGKTYLLTASYVFGGGAVGAAPTVGAPVVQPMFPDDGTALDRIATIAPLPYAKARSDLAALAEIDKDIAVTNTLDDSVKLPPDLTEIRGVADRIDPGTTVYLIGRGSGRSAGQILEVGKDGVIRTTRMSSAGDAGGPVLTADGRLVGILQSTTREFSQVLPIAEIFSELQIQLIPAGY